MKEYTLIARRNLKNLLMACILVVLLFSIFWLILGEYIFSSIWMIATILWAIQICYFEKFSLRANTNFFLICGTLTATSGAILKPGHDIEWWLCAVPVFTGLFSKEKRDIIFHSAFITIILVTIHIINSNDLEYASFFPRITLPIFQAIFSYLHFNRSLHELEINQILIRDKFKLKDKLTIEKNRSATIIAETAQKIAHDIRSPFTMVKIIIDRLKKDKLTYLEIDRLDQAVILNFNYVDSLIQNLLHSTSNPSIELTQIDLRKSISEIDKLILIPNNIKLEISINHTKTFLGNSHQIQRVLLNLVDNAVKHMSSNSKGTIWIRSQILKYASSDMVQIIVGNSGTFIPSDEITQIFNKYHSKDSSSSGIGLVICSEIISNHQGNIYCLSDREKGTEFFIEIPCADL